MFHSNIVISYVKDIKYKLRLSIALKMNEKKH